MKIPFLIFLISGIATLQLEPIATRGAELLIHAAQSRIPSQPVRVKAVQVAAPAVVCLKQQLSQVQTDMMSVLGNDPELRAELELREAQLKYQLRVAQLRFDEEMTKQSRPLPCRLQPQESLKHPLMALQCLAESRKPLS